MRRSVLPQLEQGYRAVDEILVGRGSLLKRLRGPDANARGVRWESVIEVASKSSFASSCSVRRARNHRGMWQVTVLCSDCAEESEVVVRDLDEIEREACQCGYSFVVLSVAGFEPVRTENGELVELLPRSDLSLAA